MLSSPQDALPAIDGGAGPCPAREAMPPEEVSYLDRFYQGVIFFCIFLQAVCEQEVMPSASFFFFFPRGQEKRRRHYLMYQIVGSQLLSADSRV